MRDCWICKQPHVGTFVEPKIGRWGKEEPRRFEEPPSPDPTRLDCGHREPELVQHWRRAERAEGLRFAFLLPLS